jgi:hypothetical protein
MSTTTERASMHRQVSAPADETCGEVISGGQRRTAQLNERGLSALVRSHPLGAFFTLAFAFSWAYWIPVALFAPH